jgi:hypothetical protein
MIRAGVFGAVHTDACRFFFADVADKNGGFRYVGRDHGFVRRVFFGELAAGCLERPALQR